MKNLINNSPAASVSFNGDFYRVVSMSNSGLHFADLDEPVRYYDSNVTLEILGEGVRQAVLSSKKIPAAELNGVISMVKKKAKERVILEINSRGYKSKKTLYHKMITCSVRLNSEILKILPNHHNSLDGYTGISIDGPEILHLPINSSNKEIGIAMKEGLRRCTAAPEFELPVVL